MATIQFRPIEIMRSSSKVMEQIAAMIRRGELHPGDRLPSEMDLAEQFGTSRATIREALSGLKALNLIESHTGKGNFVADSVDVVYNWDGLVDEIRTRNGFLEAIEARRAIEGEICFLAAQRADEEALRSIEAALEAGRSGLSADQFCDADHLFHLALAKASANNLFIRFIEEAFVNLSTPYWSILKQADPTTDGVFRHYEGDHEYIYAAIKEKSPSEARRRMIAHLERVRENFLKTFEE